MRDGVRRISQVSEIVGLEGATVVMNDIFQYEYEGENADGTLRGQFKVSRIRPSFMARLQYFGLDQAWLSALDEGS
jgi:pilus assembly protein CpaF